ncbi:MAG: PolC-type DNA polymerase III [Eubacteriales bacterium]
MAGQIDRFFHVEHSDILQYFQIVAVDTYEKDKKIHIKTNGLAEKSDNLLDRLSSYFEEHIKTSQILVEYEQIKELDILLGNASLFLANINHNAKNCAKQIKTLKFANNNGVLHAKYHWDISTEQENAIQKIIKHIAQIVDAECTFQKEAKTISKTTAAQQNEKTNKSSSYVFGKDTKAELCEIGEITELSGAVTIQGEITRVEIRDLKDNVSQVLSIDVTDYESSITCEKYLRDAKKKQKQYAFLQDLKKGQRVKVQGHCMYNKYKRENVVEIKSIEMLENEKLVDDADEKRIELHLHTKMSTMDGLVDIKELIETVSQYGHRAVGITDHGTVQSFPDAAILAKKKGIKLLYGIEAYLFDDTQTALTGKTDIGFDGSFVVFDLETTGLYADSNVIIEIGAVKIENGKIIDTFSTFVDPKRSIPQEVQKLTGISNSMVAGAPAEDEAVPKFIEFAQGSVLAAHNAEFDMGFLKAACKRLGIDEDFAYVDTIQIAKRLTPEKRIFKLDKLCKDYNIMLRSHHRAKDDAEATGHLLLELFKGLEEKEINKVDQIDSIKNKNIQPRNIYHAVIYAKNKAGLKNLYRLVSISNLEYLFRGKPHIPKTELMKMREGLILGSACEAGELYRAMVDGEKEEALLNIASFYDYLEIQPLGNNNFMIADQRTKRVQSVDDIISLNKKVLEIGRKLGKPVVATGDVHFMKKRDSIYRAILMYSKDFDDADNQAPLFYRNTKEMLGEFYYLDDKTAKEIVVDNPNAICDMMEDIEPLPEEKLYAPTMENAKEQIIEMSYNTAHQIYGETLPEIVQKRLDKELNSITGYGYSVMYLIAHKLVKKSNSDGYIVGSRGSVGSSFVANLTGITEVDPLPPHYTCDICNHTDFDVDTALYGCGPDLPDKTCPNCSNQLTKRGFDIPFEVFLGFKGDKVPDIDLNFSGENQATAHKYTEVLFGEKNVFRSGTISGVAEKTAYGYVMKYMEHLNKEATKAEINRLVAGCVGVRRTTGQHPGGIIVVPHEYDIHDFTPIQYPADDKECGTITTHFTFNMLHDRLVKLDILGHDDPTMLRMLQELTGLDPLTIPLDDKDTMSLFSSVDSLKVKSEDILAEMGTYGVPEFGTGFVRGMLKDTMPKTMAELVRISGLSHGTDVWLGNAQELVRSKTATLLEAICTRDDIMLALIRWGIDDKIAFDTMENVRKGRGLTEQMESAMTEAKVPAWFINSCKLIKYMFPKAHAAAYVIMAFRIAYYKVHYPLEYYVAYFSIRGEDFDALTMTCTHAEAKAKVQELRNMGNDLTAKEKGQLTVWEMVLEMLARGFEFLNVDLKKSKADKFQIVDGKILPPLNRLPGIGTTAAIAIEREREKEMFRTIDDLQQRASVNKSALESLESAGCLEGLPQSSQVSFFDL